MEKETFVKKVINVGVENVDSSQKDKEYVESSNLSENRAEQIKIVTECESSTESGKRNISDKLMEWNIKHRPSRNCVKDLIEILKEEQIVVTPFYKFNCSDRPIVEKIAGGSYGMSRNLKGIAAVVKLPENIVIDVNIDGLPLFKSANFN